MRVTTSDAKQDEIQSPGMLAFQGLFYFVLFYVALARHEIARRAMNAR